MRFELVADVAHDRAELEQLERERPFARLDDDDGAGEALTAARALDLRDTAPAPGTGAVVAALREVVDGPGPDRYLAPELQAAEELLRVDALGDALAGLGITLE